MGLVCKTLGAGVFPCDSLADSAMSHLIKPRRPFSLSMKKMEAIIKPFRMENVNRALAQLGVEGAS
jgi:hypothetical protein